MNPALLNLILSLVQLAIQDIPELISAGRTIASLLTTGADPTPEQMAELDAAYKAVSDKLDAKLAADLDVPASTPDPTAPVA